MQLPVTDNLVKYLHSRREHAADLIARGVSKACIYRILRRSVDQISVKNTRLLAQALHLTPQELVNIAVTGDARQDGAPQIREAPVLHKADPILDAICATVLSFDDLDRPDIIKLLSLWKALDRGHRHDCLDWMDAAVRGCDGGACSA